jgi:pimeloyl-ACP methyl ester carboxylesterase
MPEFTYRGHSLFYREQPGKGPLLVLLPGNTSSSAHLLSELQFFGANYRTVAQDFPGHGPLRPGGPLGGGLVSGGGRAGGGAHQPSGAYRAHLVGTTAERWSHCGQPSSIPAGERRGGG